MKFVHHHSGFKLINYGTISINLRIDTNSLVRADETGNCLIQSFGLVYFDI